MPDYRNVKYPTRLKAQPLAEGDAPTLPIGTGQTAAGMGGEGEPSQLDIVFSDDDRTLVYPANPPKGMQPRAFKGAIKSEDAVTWCRASLKAAQEPATKSEDETEATSTE